MHFFPFSGRLHVLHVALITLHPRARKLATQMVHQGLRNVRLVSSGLSQTMLEKLHSLGIRPKTGAGTSERDGLVGVVTVRHCSRPSGAPWLLGSRDGRLKGRSRGGVAPMVLKRGHSHQAPAAP